MKPQHDSERVVEWSTDTTDSIEQGKPSRMFLRIDTSGLLTLENALTTSCSESARAFEDGVRESFHLIKDDARWLIGALQAALDEQERREW